MAVLRYIPIILLIISCKPEAIGPQYPINPGLPNNPNGIYILNEGNFGWGNGSLSYFHPAEKEMFHQLFQQVNGFSLGDIPQSITYHKGYLYVIVNNSNKIWKVNPLTFEFVSAYGPFDSPRYLYFDSEKNLAYLTSLWDENFLILDASNLEVLKRVKVGGWSEKLVQSNGTWFLQVRNGGKKGIWKIDAELKTGQQVFIAANEVLDICVDLDENIWLLSNVENQDLMVEKWNPKSNVILRKPLNISPAIVSKLQRFEDHVYLLNDGLFRFKGSELAQFEKKLQLSNNPYGFLLDSSGVFISEAYDFVRPGKLSIYNHAFQKVDSANVGVNPGFMFKLEL